VRPHYFFVASLFHFGQDNPMQAKTKELLYLLLWTCETLSKPTWRNLTESFEGWAYRKGLTRQLQRLEKQHLLERKIRTPGNRLYRLTETGRLLALDGRDPEVCWKRPWDGHWRVVLFDVPEARRSARNKLRSYLRLHGFGYLQNSVWITPHPLTEQCALLAEGPVDVESLLILEACPGAGETDAELVAGAWDFVQINERYAKHGKILAQHRHRQIDTEAAATAFCRWLINEHAVWLEAISYDPLLPAALLPSEYIGRQAWRNRQEVMAEAGEQMRAFKSAK
jgi:phenylacetic acid degradation operon negative regulatory protein